MFNNALIITNNYIQIINLNQNIFLKIIRNITAEVIRNEQFTL